MSDIHSVSVSPTSHVISYFTSVSTPTEVRWLARRGLRFTAAINGLAFLICAGLVCALAISELGRMHAFTRFIEVARIPLLICFVTLACSVAQWCTADAVEIGSPRACKLASVTLIPLILGLLLASAIPAALAVYVVFGTPAPLWVSVPVAMFGLAGFFTLIIGGLLVYDLTRFLDWIEVHPTLEKPPLPFLS